jgi:hypothetical protein
MSLAYEITLAICESVYSNPHGRQHLLPLLAVNRVVCDIAIAVLWRELPSVLPLLHLMPEDVVERHLAVDGVWRYVSRFVIRDMGNPHSAIVIAWSSFALATGPTSCLRPSGPRHHLTRARSDL